MNLHPVDLAIIAVYLLAVGWIGFIVKKRATKRLDSYFLADRNVPWWMLGLSGCSSYIDIGGTMSMIGALFYLGLKSLWATHIFWGWIMRKWGHVPGTCPGLKFVASWPIIRAN